MCEQIKNVLRVFPFLCLILFGCEQGDGYGESFFSKSYITDYVYPDSLESCFVETVDDRMVMRLRFHGGITSRFRLIAILQIGNEENICLIL